MENIYIFLILIIIVFYCILSNTYQKYDQENFDSSLIPVSSVVTLANVAQKLINGGEKLINPGNLQIGLPSTESLGNLYVTGTNNVDGISTFNSSNTINGITTFVGNNTLTGSSVISNNLSANTITSNQYNDSSNIPRIQLFTDGINYYNSGPGNLHHFRGNGGNSEGGNVLVDQNLTVSGNSTINGTSTISGASTLNGETYINNRLHITGASSTPAGSGDMITHFNHSDNNNYIRGNTNVNGNLNINGNLSLNGLSNDLTNGLFSKLTKYNPGDLSTITYSLNNTRRYVILYINYKICQGDWGGYNADGKFRSGGIRLGYKIQSNNNNTELSWDSGWCCGTDRWDWEKDICGMKQTTRQTKQLLIRGQHYDQNSSSLKLEFNTGGNVNFQWMTVRFLELW